MIKYECEGIFYIAGTDKLVKRVSIVWAYDEQDVLDEFNAVQSRLGFVNGNNFKTSRVLYD